MLCVAVRVCFTCRRSSAGVCGVVEGEGVGQVGVLLMLHSDQNFQGTPELPDSKTGTRPVKRNTKASAFAITSICQTSSN